MVSFQGRKMGIMMLVDHDIDVFLNNGTHDSTGKTAIRFGKASRISTIGYDLCTKEFYRDGKTSTECELLPGESVFVGSEEIVLFDHFTVGHVVLRNSRIRMGLSLESPVYHPGHETRIYFRLTNISSNAIALSAGEGYATLNFEQLKNKPKKPYNGAFQEEFSFHGLGSYKTEYAEQIKSINGKIKTLESLEKTVYGNVITILTIFVAIFTILNVNISLTEAASSAMSYIIFNLSTVGAVSALALLLESLIDKSSRISKWLWLIPVVSFGAVLIAILAF